MFLSTPAKSSRIPMINRSATRLVFSISLLLTLPAARAFDFAVIYGQCIPNDSILSKSNTWGFEGAGNIYGKNLDLVVGFTNTDNLGFDRNRSAGVIGHFIADFYAGGRYWAVRQKRFGLSLGGAAGYYRFAIETTQKVILSSSSLPGSNYYIQYYKWDNDNKTLASGLFLNADVRAEFTLLTRPSGDLYFAAQARRDFLKERNGKDLNGTFFLASLGWRFR